MDEGYSTDGIDFTGCDSEDIGRWYMESWHDAMHSDDDEEAQRSFWFARACGHELSRRHRLDECR